MSKLLLAPPNKSCLLFYLFFSVGLIQNVSKENPNKQPFGCTHMVFDNVPFDLNAGALTETVEVEVEEEDEADLGC